MTHKPITVLSSQVASSGRLDASYHLAVQRAATHMPIFADLPPAEAAAKAQELIHISPKAVLISALGPLARGSCGITRATRARALEVAIDNPHLSLALLHKYLPAIVNYQSDQVKQAQQSMNKVMDFASDYPQPAPSSPARRKPGR